MRGSRTRWMGRWKVELKRFEPPSELPASPSVIHPFHSLSQQVSKFVLHSFVEKNFKEFSSHPAEYPVLGNFLQQSNVKNVIRCIKTPGVPRDAANAFICFLYSSWSKEQHSCLHEGLPSGKRKGKLLIFLKKRKRKSLCSTCWFCHTHTQLKRVCIHFLEQEGLLPTDNVIDVLQIKQDRLRKIEERKVYLQLLEALEALLHICRDGCRTIGPWDKILRSYQLTCGFPACKGLETLLRHFSTCIAWIPGGCVRCKRMWWQLLGLHSRMCNDPDSCKVPLCRHFKGKMQQQSKKDEAKWKLLVSKVVLAKIALGPFSAGPLELL